MNAKNIESVCFWNAATLFFNVAKLFFGELPHSAMRASNAAMWQLGNVATRQFGNVAIRQCGNSAIRQCGNSATRQLWQSCHILKWQPGCWLPRAISRRAPGPRQLPSLPNCRIPDLPYIFVGKIASCRLAGLPHY